MHFLVELNEWHLIQGIKRSLEKRKARHHPQPLNARTVTAVQHNAELLEVELRRTFALKGSSKKLKGLDFDLCKSKLKTLCSVLDDLALPQNAHSSSSEQTYPHLRALITFLETTAGDVDLVDGPNTKIFGLRQHSEDALTDYLGSVTECNNALTRLLEAPSQELVIQSVETREDKRLWKKARVRSRATLILRSLFESFRCGTPHEVLLQLIQDPDESSMLPSLQVLLSGCPELKSWQEACCISAHLGESDISCINDICADLQQNTGQGKSLMLLVKKYGIFGTWVTSSSSNTGEPSTQSLDQLIFQGAFKPLDLNTLFQGRSSEKFSTKNKRELAVKLGFCLMDFFDTELASNRIYFLNSSQSALTKALPYLSFGSKLPGTDDAYNFRIGHPTLLSFAKLLLEIEVGYSLSGVDITPNSDQNESALGRLMFQLDHLEQERSDSYVQAIRGCLLAHNSISRALSKHNLSGKEADKKVRKLLYKKVVSKLEYGLAEAIPRAAHKRRRSESPPASRYQHEEPESRMSPLAIRSAKQRPDFLMHKKQRMFGQEKKHISEDQEHLYLPSMPRESSRLRNEVTMAEASQTCAIGRTISQMQMQMSSRASIASSYSSTSFRRASRREDFQIAIICALPLEYDAVAHLFDEFWDETGDVFGRAPSDQNSYTTGRMGKYNVVLALTHVGKAHAASAAASMRASYVNIRLALLVGVCGAMPRSGEDEILLGDVVISKVIVQHDLGRLYANEFKRKNTIEDNLGRPGKDIRNLITLLGTDRGVSRLERRSANLLQEIQAKVSQTRWRGKYDYPGEDRLYLSAHRHKHHASSSTCICAKCHDETDPVCEESIQSSCADLGCDSAYLVARERLQEGQRASIMPMMHVGYVASGDVVIKSAVDRDRISKETNVIAFEMEGAGIWDEFPSIIVKGVCDYADSHKDKEWQNFAAATAASACKAILETYIQTDHAERVQYRAGMSFDAPQGAYLDSLVQEPPQFI